MTNRADRSVRVRHEPPSYLPELLRAGRHRIHLSQADAAADADICVAYLSKLENGHRCPSAVVARKLAEVLHLTNAEKSLVIEAGIPGVGYDYDYDSTPAPRGAF